MALPGIRPRLPAALRRDTYESSTASPRRLTSVTRDSTGVGAQYTYGYSGAARQPTSVSYPNGQQMNYVYDDFGQLVSSSSSDTGTTRTVFDSRGVATERLEQDASRTAMTYDRALRLLVADYDTDHPTTFAGDTYYYWDVIHSSATCPTSGSCSNTNGHLAQVDNDILASTTLLPIFFGYDLVGRQTYEAEVISSTAYETSYTYDSAGRLTDVRYPFNTQHTAHYSYDLLGTGDVANFPANAERITAIDLVFGPNSVNLVNRIEHAPDGTATAIWYHQYGSGSRPTNPSISRSQHADHSLDTVVWRTGANTTDDLGVRVRQRRLDHVDQHRLVEHEQLLPLRLARPPHVRGRDRSGNELLDVEHGSDRSVQLRRVGQPAHLVLARVGERVAHVQLLERLESRGQLEPERLDDDPVGGDVVARGRDLRHGRRAGGSPLRLPRRGRRELRRDEVLRVLPERPEPVHRGDRRARHDARLQRVRPPRAPCVLADGAGVGAENRPVLLLRSARSPDRDARIAVGRNECSGAVLLERDGADVPDDAAELRESDGPDVPLQRPPRHAADRGDDQYVAEQSERGVSRAARSVHGGEPGDADGSRGEPEVPGAVGGRGDRGVGDEFGAARFAVHGPREQSGAGVRAGVRGVFGVRPNPRE